MMNDASKTEYAMAAIVEEIGIRGDDSGEALESEIFWAMAGRGYSSVEVDDAIGALLDSGVIASTVSQSKYGFKACLRRAA